MIRIEYINGESLYGFFSRTNHLNAFTSRYLFATKERKYARRKTAVYIAPFLTETVSARLADNLGEVIRVTDLNKIKNAVEKELGPFSAMHETVYDYLVEKELKYCPKCIRKGRHFIYQQLKTEKTCREHGVPLTKGCPHCGTPLPHRIDIEDELSFVCPACRRLIVDQKAFYEPENPKEVASRHKIDYANVFENAYITTMEGAETVFEKPESLAIVEKYLKTGIRPAGGISIGKAELQNKSLHQLVMEMAQGKLKATADDNEIINFIIEHEEVGCAPEDRALSYLLRSHIKRFNPPRLEISTLHDIFFGIKRRLKVAGIEDESVPGLARVVLQQYMCDTMDAFKSVVEKHPNSSLLLLKHEQQIPKVNYGLLIIETDQEYQIFYFK